MEMELMAAAIAVIYALVEAIKWLSKRHLGKSKQDRHEEMHELLKDLAAMHHKTDASGKPLWYVDPAMVNNQRIVINILDKNRTTIENIQDEIHRLELDTRQILTRQEAILDKLKETYKISAKILKKK